MPAEEIIRKFENERKAIADALERQDELLGQLRSLGTEDYDWITVKEAAARAKTSACTVYALINSGRLKSVKHFGSRKFVKWSEVAAIDDGYSERN